MAQISMNAYDADVFIPEFKGLMQYGDHLDGDLRFSPDCMNIATPGGVLQPSFAYEDFGEELTGYKASNPYELTRPNYCTFMRYRNSNGDWNYYMYLERKLYRGDFRPDTPEHDFEWTLLHTFTGAKGPVSWCVYEYTPEGETAPKNILLFSDKTCGMYSVDEDTVTAIQTPKNFSHIEVYGERIWGCNGDEIYYSAPYSYSDWSQNDSQPEAGAGSFREPTWNDDPINCLIRYGDCLMAFTKDRAWKISGVAISSLYVQEQYGNGTDSPHSVVRYRDVLYMVRNGDGICVYNGTTVVPISNQYAKDYTKFRSAQATVRNNMYMVSDPMYPGKMLILNMLDNTITVCESPLINSFCEDSEYAIRWFIVRDELNYPEVHVKPVILYLDSWEDQKNSGFATRWATPWITFGRKDIKKGGFDLYFMPELADNAEDSVTFKISFQNEKKTKTKYYEVTPLSPEEISAGKRYKQKKLHFGGSGRMFRMIIETEEGITTPWRLIGGIHIIAETDKD